MAVLGSVSLSHEGTRPTQPRRQTLGMQALGRGIGSLSDALSVQAESVLQLGESRDALIRAREARDFATERSGALVDFARIQGEYSRDLIRLKQETDPTGRNIEAEAEAALEGRLSTFTSGLSPKLQEALAPTIEEYRQSQRNSAFGTRLSLEGENFTAKAQQLQFDIAESVYRGDRTLDEWLPVLNEFYAGSPFDGNSTAEMRKGTLRYLQGMSFGLEAADAIQHPEISGQMSGPLAGLMNIIADKESGGEANVMYSPGDRRYFNDFSKHPNMPETITSGPNAGKKSSAAGLLMFTAGTWDRVQSALGLPDFSPESQLKGGIYLAKEDYKARTGRDLESDLSSGDPLRIEAVRKALTPTWEALGGVSAEDFYAAVTNGEGPQIALMDDPRFSELSYSDKLGLLEKAAKDAKARQSAAIAEFTKEQTSAIDGMQRTIDEGFIPEQNITNFAEQWRLSYEQERALRTQWETRNKEALQQAGFVEGLADPTHYFTKEDKAGFDSLYDRAGTKEVNSLNQDYMNQLFSSIQKSTLMPSGLVDDLHAMSLSADPARASFGLTNMVALRAMSPALFAENFSKEDEENAVYFQTMAPYLPEAARIEDIRRMTSPEFSTQRTVLTQQVQQSIAKNAADFRPEVIIDKLGLNGWFTSAPTFDATTAASLTAAYTQLYEREFVKYGDHAKAGQAAAELMKSQWGVSQIGSDAYLMENPPGPGTRIQPVAGSYDWLADSVRADLPELGDRPFRLGSDAQTEAEKKRGQPVSYMVMTEVLPGQWLPEFRGTHPVRVAFDEPARQNELQVEGGIWYNKYRNLSNVQQAAYVGALQQDEASAAVLALSNSLLRELETNRPAGGKYYKSGTPAFNFDINVEDIFTAFGIQGQDAEQRITELSGYTAEELREAYDPSALSAEGREALMNLMKGMRP